MHQAGLSRDRGNGSAVSGGEWNNLPGDQMFRGERHLVLTSGAKALMFIIMSDAEAHLAGRAT